MTTSAVASRKFNGEIQEVTLELSTLGAKSVDRITGDEIETDHINTIKFMGTIKDGEGYVRVLECGTVRYACVCVCCLAWIVAMVWCCSAAPRGGAGAVVPCRSCCSAMSRCCCGLLPRCLPIKILSQMLYQS